MLRALIQVFVGCSHQRTTFPITPTPGSNQTYVSCLDCGREFEYDWAEMRRGKPATSDRPAPGTFVTTRV